MIALRSGLFEILIGWHTSMRITPAPKLAVARRHTVGRRAFDVEAKYGYPRRIVKRFALCAD
jgi:hypothetical protein